MSMLSNPYIRKESLPNSRIERYRYNLMRSGLPKDKDWLTKMIMSGRVLYPLFLSEDIHQWKQLTGEVSRRMYLDSFLGYLDKIGEQYEWDMHVEVTTIRDGSSIKHYLKLCPVIRFREFTIENTDGDERDLTELFVFFYLQVTCMKDNKMVLRPSLPRGMRTLFHEDEYNSGYIHSHLGELHSGSHRERSAREVKIFCIGNDHQEELIALLGANYDPHIFISFLMILRTMVEWESQEGVPYMHIAENISSREVQPESAPGEQASLIKAAMDPIFEYLKNSSEKLDFTIRENHYSVRITRELEEEFKEQLIVNEHYNFLTKRISGRWIKYDANRAGHLIHDQNDEVFIFGGEELKLAIYNDHPNDDENHDDINNYRIYPKFLNYVKLQINARLYHYQISRGFAQAES